MTRCLKIKKVEYVEIKGSPMPKYQVFYLPGNGYSELLCCCWCICKQTPCRSITEGTKRSPEEPESLLCAGDSQGEQSAPKPHL